MRLIGMYSIVNNNKLQIVENKKVKLIIMKTYLKVKNKSERRSSVSRHYGKTLSHLWMLSTRQLRNNSNKKMLKKEN